MVYQYSCSHLATAANIPITTIINSKEHVCADCDCQGPNLWICLHKNCLQIGCAEKSNDHSTLHNAQFPSHCVHMNLSTRRIWCYECNREVFLDSHSYNDSDQETESGTARSRDSGHGSYSTLRTNTPDRGTPLDRTACLTVGMSGDASDSSDPEDPPDYNNAAADKPNGGLVGLQNIGNTCYMNAALQALSNTEPLTRFFLDCAHVVQVLSEGKKPGLSRTYQALVRDVWVRRVSQGYVTPSGILYGIRNVHAMFRGYHQHDTQEFLRNFMDQLHEELKQMAPAEVSVSGDSDTFSLAMEEPAFSCSSYDSSEGEYETCDSGVSERSSLSDDTDRPASSSAKRRLSRCASPSRRQRQRVQNPSCVIDSQPSTSDSSSSANPAAAAAGNKRQTKYRSIISDIFDGKLLSSVQCLTCDRISSRVETFQDLSLPIPSRDHLVVLHGRPSPPAAPPAPATCSDALVPQQDGSWMSWILAWLRSWFYGPTVTLHDCLAAFFSTDELKGDNMYSCERCNKLRNGVKFSKVLQLPEVLCIHLKRFRHELMFSSKISSAVSFPLQGLDMTPYLHTDCTSKVFNYELFSVICHHGTAGGGHYTCFAVNSGQWYEFDDQYVTKVSPDKVQTCEAYVLFYQKVNRDADAIREKAEKIMEMAADDVKRTYISRQWINRFYYCAEPGPIDNSDFLCQHCSVNPDRDIDIDKLAMVIPFDVYDYLYKKFGGYPPYTNLGVCPACTAMQKRLLLEMETFLQISREAQNQDMPHTHYLSTSWYTQWHNFVQKRNQEPPGPIDNTKILPNQLDLNEAADVPECIWNFFYNIYGGGPEIRIKPSIVRKAASEESLPDTMEDSSTTYTLPKRTDSSASIPNTPPEFVIPTLRRDRIEAARPLIDKSMYCHGDSMETETHVSGPAVELEAGGAQQEVLDNLLVKRDNGSQVCQASSSPSVTNVVDDDIDEEEANEIRNNKRHRRRRKNLVSS